MIWLDQSSPTANNYAIDGTSTTLQLNAPTTGNLQVAKTTVGSWTSTAFGFNGTYHTGVSGTTAGCLAMYATDTNTTLMYETVTSSGTVTWTSTKPANCN